MRTQLHGRGLCSRPGLAALPGAPPRSLPRPPCVSEEQDPPSPQEWPDPRPRGLGDASCVTQDRSSLAPTPWCLRSSLHQRNVGGGVGLGHLLRLILCSPFQSADCVTRLSDLEQNLGLGLSLRLHPHQVARQGLHRHQSAGGGACSQHPQGLCTGELGKDGASVGSEHPVTPPRALGPALRLGCDGHSPLSPSSRLPLLCHCQCTGVVTASAGR